MMKKDSFIVKEDWKLSFMSRVLDFLDVLDDEECARLLEALKARLLRLSRLPISAEIIDSYVALECVPEGAEEDEEEC